MAGVWERMIRSVGTVLAAILDKHSLQLDDELLHTFMEKAEAIVISRPITYINMSSTVFIILILALLICSSMCV